MSFKSFESKVIASVEASTQADIIRSTNKAVKRMQRKASKSRRNSNVFGKTAANLQSVKAMLSRDARHFHLARAFCSGTPYKKVESSVKENNEVAPHNVATKAYYMMDVEGISSETFVNTIQEWLDSSVVA